MSPRHEPARPARPPAHPRALWPAAGGGRPAVSDGRVGFSAGRAKRPGQAGVRDVALWTSPLFLPPLRRGIDDGAA